MNSEVIAEFQSPRTKCIAFHPSKPIMLTSHHTSEIHAYDLHLHAHIFTFQAHDGPVRAIVFHHTSDIFVSGGDDCKIILWSYSKKKALKVFKGHTDYIRSLDFHPQNPWFLSTSDDQSIKVWNFQSYKLLSTITGHSHYVMCAKFFGKYIVSCSLDQTIRVWDYEGLSKRKENNLIGVPNIIVKQILDAHDRGINNLYVHKTKHMFLSCADDRQVKVWQMGDSIYEKEVYYSHSNNVTGCAFVNDKVVSVGEDGYLVIEGGGKKKSESRLWCVATDKEERFFAVGCDSGVTVYKAKGEKEIYSYDGAVVYHCKDKKVLVNNLEDESVAFKLKKECISLKTVECAQNDDQCDTSNNKEKASHCNYSDCLLVQYVNAFDVVRNKEVIYSGNGIGLLMRKNIVSAYRNVISINDDILFNSDSVIDLYRIDDNSLFIIKKKCVDWFDINTSKINISWKITDIKKIAVCKKYFALLGTRKMVLIERLTNTYNTYDELTEVKDGFFEGDLFIYSTMRHIKYIYAGVVGILRSMEKEISVLFMKNNFIYYIHRDSIENVKVNMDSIGIIRCIKNNDDEGLGQIVDSSKILSESMINYIISNKKSHLVSKYVDETKTGLLMEIGKFDECFRNLEAKGDTSMLESLYSKCIKNKEIEVAEKCLWKLKDYTRLFYLFICSKQVQKLEMLKEFGNYNFKLNLGLFLNDDEYVKKLLYKKKVISEMNTFGEIKEKYNIEDKLNKHGKKSNYEKNKVTNADGQKVQNFDDKIYDKEQKMVDDNEKYNEEVQDITENNDEEEKYDEDKKTNSLKSKTEEEQFVKSNAEQNDTQDILKHESTIDESTEEAAIIDSTLEKSDLDIASEEKDDKHKNVSESLTEESEDKNEKPSSFISHEVETKLNLNTVCHKHLVKDELVIADIDYDAYLKSALENVTRGKFSSAIATFRQMINTLANNLTHDSDLKDKRAVVGNYLSGILIEKQKKKVDDPKKVLVMSSYFPSLAIEPVHKNLALSNFMVQCYKNGNFDMAKEIAKQIVPDSTTEKMVNKVLKSAKQGNCVEIGKGVFCFDSARYEDESVKCMFCFVSSSKGQVCSCCEVGVLK